MILTESHSSNADGGKNGGGRSVAISFGFAPG
jgi:hypothetical protein